MPGGGPRRCGLEPPRASRNRETGAPAAMGVLFDRGYSVEAVAAACALYCLAASGLAALAREPRNVVAREAGP